MATRGKATSNQNYFLALGASGLLEAPGPRAVTEKVTLATGGASGLVLVFLVREP